MRRWRRRMRGLNTRGGGSRRDIFPGVGVFQNAGYTAGRWEHRVLPIISSNILLLLFLLHLGLDVQLLLKNIDCILDDLADNLIRLLHQKRLVNGRDSSSSSSSSSCFSSSSTAGLVEASRFVFGGFEIPDVATAQPSFGSKLRHSSTSTSFAERLRHSSTSTERLRHSSTSASFTERLRHSSISTAPDSVSLSSGCTQNQRWIGDHCPRL